MARKKFSRSLQNTVYRKFIPHTAMLPDSHPELPIDPDVLQPRVFKRPVHLSIEFQLTVFIGGCIGGLARYGVTLISPAEINGWPVTTFIINLIGALFLGILLEALARCGDDSGKRRIVRLGMGTGFTGAFTTYSTLAIEAQLLLRSNHLIEAVTYALLSVICGIALSGLGIQLAATYNRRRGIAL
jgi:CrcB protein